MLEKASSLLKTNRHWTSLDTISSPLLPGTRDLCNFDVHNIKMCTIIEDVLYNIIMIFIQATRKPDHSKRGGLLSEKKFEHP